MKTNYSLGVDIGGTKCTIVAGTEQMEFLERIQFATETAKGPDYAINKLLENSKIIVEKLGDHTLTAIGISCGGPLNSIKGIIQSPPNLPGWNNIHIVQIFKEKFSVPVYLQNDANACALAEWQFGAGKGTDNMIFLTFGTGLGAGLILNGCLYTGANDLAGEAGHIRLAEDGPEAYGKKGSFEGFCSGSGIKRMSDMVFTKKILNGEKTTLCQDESEVHKMTTKDLAEAASSGDKTALEIFETSGRYLGLGLSILIDILNPQRIVIGSVYARHPHLFEEACRKAIQKEALKSAAKACEIVPSALGEQVGDYGSLCVAMMHHLA